MGLYNVGEYEDIETPADLEEFNQRKEDYGVKATGERAFWNLGRGGPRYRAAAGLSGLKGEQDIQAIDEFGTKDPAKIAKAITLEQLGQYRDQPEQFGLSEAEKQAAADKAAAASGAQAATALTQAAREMKGGGTTGYAAQAMREATEPGRQGAATASQQALQQSRQMIAEKGTSLYNQLLGIPAIPPTVWQKMAAGAGAEALASGAELGLEYMDKNLLGDVWDPNPAPVA
jgi:hypothetical protein